MFPSSILAVNERILNVWMTWHLWINPPKKSSSSCHNWWQLYLFVTHHHHHHHHHQDIHLHHPVSELRGSSASTDHLSPLTSLLNTSSTSASCLTSSPAWTVNTTMREMKSILWRTHQWKKLFYFHIVSGANEVICISDLTF